MTENTGNPLLNSQNITLLAPLSSDQILHGFGGARVRVVDNALAVSEFSVGENSSIEDASSNLISTYVIQSGDTLSEIAQKFNVSVNTIVWANDLKTKTIRVGQELIILPVSGIRHTVKKGDTLAKIVKKYKGDLDETLLYNDLVASSDIVVGEVVTIPGGLGEAPKVVTKTTSRTTSSKSSSGAWTNTKTVWHNGVRTSPLRGTGGPNYVGYYIRPITGYGKSRGLHGYNGIDFAAPKNTPVLAAAGGTVIIAKYSGWNGGYGKYVTIKHTNGTQTLYSHMNSVAVYSGQTVVAGQVIGRVGTTGNSSGNHLHFEVRGAKNPF